MEEVLHSILLLIGFIAVLVAAYFVTRFIGSRMSQGTGSKYLKIVDRIILGNDKSICIVQVGNCFYLIGISNHHVELLGEIDSKNLIPLEARQVTFNGLLNKYMTNRRDKSKEQMSSIDKIKEKLEQRKEKFKKL